MQQRVILIVQPRVTIYSHKADKCMVYYMQPRVTVYTVTGLTNVWFITCSRRWLYTQSQGWQMYGLLHAAQSDCIHSHRAEKCMVYYMQPRVTVYIVTRPTAVWFKACSPGWLYAQSQGWQLYGWLHATQGDYIHSHKADSCMFDYMQPRVTICTVTRLTAVWLSACSSGWL